MTATLLTRDGAMVHPNYGGTAPKPKPAEAAPAATAPAEQAPVEAKPVEAASAEAETGASEPSEEDGDATKPTENAQARSAS